jgi:hypothetical protein
VPAIRPYAGPSVTTPTKAAVPDSVRAAQRAFFQAALTAAPAQQATASAAAVPMTQPFQPVQPPAPARSIDSDAPADRILRPGSLVDIRV